MPIRTWIILYKYFINKYFKIKTSAIFFFAITILRKLLSYTHLYTRPINLIFVWSLSHTANADTHFLRGTIYGKCKRSARRDRANIKRLRLWKCENYDFVLTVGGGSAAYKLYIYLYYVYHITIGKCKNNARCRCRTCVWRKTACGERAREYLLYI